MRTETKTYEVDICEVIIKFYFKDKTNKEGFSVYNLQLTDLLHLNYNKEIDIETAYYQLLNILSGRRITFTNKENHTLSTTVNMEDYIKHETVGKVELKQKYTVTRKYKKVLFGLLGEKLISEEYEIMEIENG